MIKAARDLDDAKPLVGSGHSLGSPLSTLATLDIAQRIPALRESLRPYSDAGARLGDRTFAEALTRRVPNSDRLINLADLVPILPPTQTGNGLYVHLGEAWAFTSASGAIGPNHFISAYREAIEP